jgi:sec-independent protein translocase protein TatC
MPELTRHEPRDPDREAVMSFGDHLDELRKRLVRALIAPIPLMVLAFLFATELRAVLEEPLRSALRANDQSDLLQSLGVLETMAVDLKLAFVFGLVASSPWILWQAWKFVEPGLYEHERRFARLLVPGSIFLTLAGAATLYFVLLPFSLEVLVNYGMEERGGPPPRLVAQNDSVSDPNAEPATVPPSDAPLGAGIPILEEAPKEVRLGVPYILLSERILCIPVAPDGKTVQVLVVPLARHAAYMQAYRLSEYHDFVLLMLLGVAVAFQMPLVILLLGWVGIVRVDMLRTKRKYAVFILTIVSAVVTPTSDITSMLLMLVPLYLLYELGIILLVLVPPTAVSEGRVLGGIFDRIRRAPRGGRTATSSGKPPSQTAQAEPAARPAPSPTSADERSAPRRREPDGDADEDADRGGSA